MSLAYWGSKKKLSSPIADILCSVGGEGRDYYEPFCGMASVGVEVMRCDVFRRMTWCDLDPNIVRYWNGVRRGWLPPTTPITQSYWDELRATSRPSMARCFYGYHFGWGGHFLAGKTLVRDKNTEHHLTNVRDRIREVGTLMRSQENRLHLDQCSFRSLRPRRGSVIYCDPPYVRTDGGSNQTRHFTTDDMNQLWDCMRRWIRQDGCIVFLSASERPKPPRDMSLTTVGKWEVYNNTASIRPHAPRTRSELLLLVR